MPQLAGTPEWVRNHGRQSYVNVNSGAEVTDLQMEDQGYQAEWKQYNAQINASGLTNLLTTANSNYLTTAIYTMAGVAKSAPVVAPVVDDVVAWLRRRVDEMCWKGV